MYQQLTDPLGSIWLSALLAFLPIFCFSICLLVFKLKGYQTGFITVIVVSVVALYTYDMPFSLIGASFVQGFAQGVWPITWIVIVAIFLYKPSVKSGSFEAIKESVMTVTPDHRIQVILIGFYFSSFLKGAIDFGEPVTITTALLVGLRLKPLHAAGFCLIANTTPVAFGAVGIPIIAMSNLVGIEQYETSAMVGRMLVLLSLSVPFFIVFLMDGIKGVRETFPVVSITALSFTIMQFISSNYLGVEFPDIVSTVISFVCIMILLKFWSPRNIFRFGDLTDFSYHTQLEFGKVLKAWLPFILLIVCIIVWTQPWFKAFFDKGVMFDYIKITLSFNNTKGSIVDSASKTLSLNMDINLIALQAGTAILIMALLTIFFLRIRSDIVEETLGDTLKKIAMPCITIDLVVAFAFIAKSSGMNTTLRTTFATTGDASSFSGPIIGWIGVFLTSSDTSTNLLFKPLQRAAATSLAVPEALFLTANSAGGTVGEMVSPQSIAIACTAVGLVSKESDLFKSTLKYSIGFIILIGVWTCIITFLMPGIIPEVIAK